MAKWLQLWNAWEVQLLVLVSFILQVFLLSTGRIRRRSTNLFLRLCIWVAYLAADSVAVFVLGFLSRQVDGGASGGRGASEGHGAPHPLAFIWAPFLLVHLGGQDSITAFAIEDNNLWLRHLLNLAVQVALALYVFWKSTGTSWRDDVRLLAPGVLVFLAGIIKYGERTIALKFGSLRGLESVAADDRGGHMLPERANCVRSDNPAVVSCSHPHSYVVSAALHSMAGVRDIFAGHTIYQMNGNSRHALSRYHKKACPDLTFKLVGVELAIMYDDLYTKAAVLRTRTGIVARCVSQISTGVALGLFLASSKHKYNRVDVAVTYLLFVGCFCLELCSTLMIMNSPWTWAWFKAREYSWIASTSWWLLSSTVGWPEERPLWSNSVGQYNFLSYVGEYQQHSGLCRQKLMTLVRKTVNFVGVGKDYLFPISKVLDTRFVDVDGEIMARIAKVVQDYSDRSDKERQFRNLGPLLPKIEKVFANDFGGGIIMLHVLMEEHFSRYTPSASHMDHSEGAVVRVCQKLSNYMIYLFVNKPEMLPVSGATEATLKSFRDQVTESNDSYVPDRGFLRRAGEEFKDSWLLPELPQSKETAEEMRDMWVRLLLYAAGKSRPEMHAAQLREGGELLTFAWLLMAHKGLGDSGHSRIELNSSSQQRSYGAYVFHLDHSQQSAAQSAV